MKKYLLYPLVFLLFRGNPLRAQEKPPRWSIGLAAGPAYPTGKFADLHNGVSTSGSVHPGGSAEISGSYQVCPSFSATLVVSGQINRGDGIPYNDPPSGSPVISDTYNDHYWRMARVQAGGVYTLPLSKDRRFALLVRVLGGIQKTKTADYSFAGYLPSSGLTKFTYHGLSLPWTFTYEADAGLKWQLKRRIALVGYAGYNGCRPGKGLVYSIDRAGDTYTLRATFPTGTVQGRIGIQYYFPY